MPTLAFASGDRADHTDGDLLVGALREYSSLKISEEDLYLKIKVIYPNLKMNEHNDLKSNLKIIAANQEDRLRKAQKQGLNKKGKDRFEIYRKEAYIDAVLTYQSAVLGIDWRPVLTDEACELNLSKLSAKK